MASLSVIIPVLNEEGVLARTLREVSCAHPGLEIIVVDGGSGDQSVAIASGYAKVLVGKRGRGKQMNHGAAHAAGDVLIFLHADTIPSASYFAEVSSALEDPEVVGGHAPLRFHPSSGMLRIYERLSNVNFWLFHYGDGAMFVKRKTFEEMGGFRELPLLEDLEFLRRMRRRGRTVLLETPVLTSARRFLRVGTMYNQTRNILIVISFLMGVSARRLARWYPDVRD
jgi:uncharacterized protein